MSNSVFQSVMQQLKDVTDRTFGVMDAEGCVISCTDINLQGERWPDAVLKVSSAPESMTTFAQKTFKVMLSSVGFFEYAVFCTGDDELAKVY